MKYPSEATAIIKEKYPKFSKIQLCNVNNEEYGVRLSEGAEQLLVDRGIITPPADSKRLNRPKTQRKKKNRMTVYVDDVEYEKVKSFMEANGYKTVQEYLMDMIRRQDGHN